MTLAVVFSPQGSQAVGMGRELAEASPAARDMYQLADGLLGWSVSELCWNGPAERLNDTRQTQPCLVATSLACYAALHEAAAPDVSHVAGHSVGEYAALVAAGVLDAADAIRVAARRGELMADAAPAGGMVAVLGLDRAAVSAAIAPLSHDVVVANDNAPGQVVVSGSAAGLERASDALRAAGAKRVMPLRVSGPFHSPRMDPVAAELRRAFEDASWSDARIPMVSNVTAEPITEASIIRETLAWQVRSPVEWVRSVERMVADGVDTFIECGPGGVLLGMVRRIAPHATTLGVQDTASLQATVDALQTVGSAA